MIVWDDRNPWLYLPGGGVREVVTRQAREQKPVPGGQRAACGHPYGCALLECLARQALGRLTEKEERARQRAAETLASPGTRRLTPDPYLAEPPPNPAGEVEAALREFDAWYLAGKGALPDPKPLPAGMCRSCRLSMTVTDGQCFWCCLAEAEKNENLARAREAAAPGIRRAAARRRRIAAGILVMLACWAAVIVLGLTGGL